MKPETIEVIRKRLTCDLEQAEKNLLWQIQMNSVDGVSLGVEEKIRKYREAYDILKDFEVWTAMRNENGEGLTEDFKSRKPAVRWLHGYGASDGAYWTPDKTKREVRKIEKITKEC